MARSYDMMIFYALILLFYLRNQPRPRQQSLGTRSTHSLVVPTASLNANLIFNRFLSFHADVMRVVDQISISTNSND